MHALCLVALAVSLDVSSVKNPRAHDGWVSDGANMIGYAEEKAIEALAQSLHESIGLELAVVTVDRVGGPTRAFAVELFNHWGVGDKDLDNGLLFFVSKSERALESVTGDGYRDVLTDAWLKRMQDGTMIPHFKRGKPGQGLLAGVQAVATFLRKGAPGEGAAIETPTAPQPVASTERSAPRPSATSDETTVDHTAAWAIGGGGAGTAGLIGLGLYWRRRRRRTCGTCKGLNILLDEVADDAFLESGQKTEERIGSVDYDVWYCQACQRGWVYGNRKWFSGFSRCPECRYKARAVSSTTISAATTSSSGRERIDEGCRNCSFTRTSYRTIPRIVESSSSSGSSFGSSGSSFSSSSSGSSFGGGSSSGGGASSSW